jgi:hypothetical protein
MKKVSLLVLSIFVIPAFLQIQHHMLGESKDSHKPVHRFPASDDLAGSTCMKSLDTILEDDYLKGIIDALEKKELVQVGDGYIKSRKPSRGFYLRMKNGLFRILKGLNKKKYPTYYVDSDETVAAVNVYPELYAKQLMDGSESGGEVVTKVDEWIAKYKNYEVDINNLTEERVALAYNINFLKSIKPYVMEAFSNSDPADQVFKTNIILRQNGQDVDRSFVFHKGDGHYEYEIQQLIRRRQEIDGGALDFLLDQGELRQRIMEQARLHDIVRMHHRELEYFINNKTADMPKEVVEKLNERLADLDNLVRGYEEYEGLLPSDFGMHKIENQKLRTEMVNLPRSTKGRYIFRKVDEITDKYMDDESKKRLQLQFKGYARVFQATGLGAAGYAIFEGGSIVKGIWTYYTYDRNRIDECNKSAGTKDSKFNACIAEFIREKYPFVYQKKILDPSFDMFNLEEVPDDVSDKDKTGFQKLMDKVLTKRSLYLLVKTAEKKISQEMQMEVNNALKDLSQDLDVDNLNPCVKVSFTALDKCMIDYLSVVFDVLYSQKSSSSSVLKQNYRNYEAVPEEFREEYEAKVEEILEQRKRYLEYRREVEQLNIQDLE